jgi:tetratricopeptide (TPR) repeat protein
VTTDVAAAPAADQLSKARVFISYSRKDIEFANRLDAALKARGFEPLIDRSDIYAFEEWWQRIEALIARADTVVFVISPDGVASDVALKEVAHAASLNKRFAPIVCRRVEDQQVPEVLRRLNYIFFDDPAQFDHSADQLAEALNTDIAWIRQHTEVGEQARRWAQAKQPSGLLLRSPVLERAERWIASRPRGAPAPTEETQAFLRQSRQGATRRRNALTGSLAAGLVLALALAGLAYWQRGVAVEQRSIAQLNEQQAKVERDNATRNFQLAQKTAESLVFDIAQGLRDVQGMSATTVRKILETAKATFEQLTASAAGDLTLQRSRSVMLNEFGDTYQDLGDLDQALRSYREALAVRERLAATDPSNTDWQRDVSVSHSRVGDVLLYQGKLDDALQAYRDGLAIHERAGTDPSNTKWQRDVSVSHSRVGEVLVRQGKLDEALKGYRDSLAIRERLVAVDPKNTQWQRDLSISYRNIGDVLAKQRKLDEALNAYREALAIAERLAATDPNNTRWQNDLSVSHNKIGNILKEQGKLDEAIKAYRDSLALAERLTAADPSNTDRQRNRSIYYEKIGDVLFAQGKLDQALKTQRDSIAVRERLAAADPNNTEWQRDLLVSYNRVGNVLRAQGRLDEALKVYRDSFVIAERLAASDPSNMQWQRDLLASCFRIGDTLKAEGKLDEALRAYRGGVASFKQLRYVARDDPLWQNDLQSSIDTIGGLSYSSLLAHNFEVALEAADQIISLAPDKLWLYTNRAHALMFLDRTDEARALYLQHRGRQKVSDDKSWEAVVLGDFAELRKAGLTHRLMDEIEKQFAGS